jgi:molecular chaperone DnaK (HSP70)
MSAAKQSRKVVAIDFGTSTTLVAVRPANGIPEVISIGDQLGVTLMPSIIDFDDLANVGESVAVHRQYRSVKSDLTRFETVDVTDCV